MELTIDPSSIKVAVLAGGRSGERSISLSSGAGVEMALKEAGFTVEMLDPASQNDLVKLIQGGFDVAFLALHGKYGEDGTMQGFLEIAGIPYTGPGVWSSATAIDKPKAKVYYERYGVATPKSLLLDTAQVDENEIVAQVGEKCVVKAATEGSALGVYICNGAQEVRRAIDAVFEIDSHALAETFVEGEEFTVAVLGNEDAQVLPVIRIVPANEFYDFESKYAEGGSKHICPAPLSEEDTAKAQAIALAAHKALECTGVSRTDLIQDATGKFWALETNTIPGMTATSLLPDAARAAGIDFPDLCALMVQNALEIKH